MGSINFSKLKNIRKIDVSKASPGEIFGNMVLRAFKSVIDSAEKEIYSVPTPNESATRPRGLGNIMNDNSRVR